MAINRTYQGRITNAHWVEEKKSDRIPESEITEAQWHSLIADHLGIYHCAVNYYLTCFAACAKGSDIEPLRNLYQRVSESWDGHVYRRGGVGPGFRESLAEYLPSLVSKTSSFVDVCDLLVKQTDANRENLHLALESLLTDLGGESSIQQGGRSYLPYFCSPKSTANFPRNKLVTEREKAKIELPRILHSAEGDAYMEIRKRFKIHHFSKLANSRDPHKGETVKKMLGNFLSHLSENKLVSSNQSNSWAKEIQALEPKGLEMRAYAGASAKGVEKNRLYAFLLFKFLPENKERFEVLRSTFPEPKEPQANKKKNEKQQNAEAIEKRLRSKGDDPISLARDDKGYVFKSFTRQLEGTSNEDCSPAWVEFDISAFKQALLTLNQIEQKTTERLELLGDIESQIEYYKTRKGTPFHPDEPVTFLNDPRFDLWKPLRQQLIDQAQNEFESYGLGWRTIKGWSKLMPRMQNYLKKNPNAAKQELLENVIIPFQQKNRNIGSVLLFENLADPGFHSFWREIDDSQTKTWQKNQWSLDLLSDLVQYEQLLEQKADLEENLHIRITPAHIKRSRRPIMLSDFDGATKVVHLDRGSESTPSIITSIYTAGEKGNQYSHRRIEFCYSAPRLLRDNLTGTENRNLLPPLLKALDLQQPEPQDVAMKPKALAVALMPDWLSSSNKTTQNPDRFLLNFPAKLETDWIAKAIGKSERWKGQFNGVKNEFIHLHWPDTLKKQNEDNAWWKNEDILANGFTLTSVDLGLRTAASFATLHVVSSYDQIPANKRKYSRNIGNAGGKEWHAYPKSIGTFRLPGENSKTLRPSSRSDKVPSNFLPEFGGSRGRLADTGETEEYCHLVEDFSFCAAEWLQEKSKINPPYHLPEQNDDLLSLARQTQSHLSSLHHVLNLARQPDLLNRKPETLNERQKARLQRAIQHQTPEEQDALTIRIFQTQKSLKQLLIVLANRILPQRDFDWTIVEQPETKLTNRDGVETSFTPFFLKRIRRKTASGRKIRGQRGLAAPRIEQLENLRRRMSSLQRELNRKPGEEQKIGFGRQSGIVPETSQEILDKLDHLKEQRVKQTAHLILARALGLRLKAGKTPKPDRPNYVHGEYEKIPNATTSDFIVIENLMRYRMRSDRSRFENRKLMHWSHRSIANTLIELAEPYGIPVLMSAASYSSRFCSLTSRPGFRAIEINSRRLDHPAFKRLLETEQGTLENSMATHIKNILCKYPENKQLRLLVPMEGGPLFVPTISDSETRNDFPVSQADINAAHNLGLRAIAAPERFELLHRIRATTSKNVTTPRTENVREKSSLDKTSSIVPVGGSEFTKEIRSKKFANFFIVNSGTFDAAFDNATLKSKDGVSLKLSSSYGLWSTVNNLKIRNLVEINNRLLAEHKLPQIPIPAEDRIPGI